MPTKDLHLNKLPPLPPSPRKVTESEVTTLTGFKREASFGLHSATAHRSRRHATSKGHREHTRQHAIRTRPEEVKKEKEMTVINDKASHYQKHQMLNEILKCSQNTLLKNKSSYTSKHRLFLHSKVIRYDSAPYVGKVN